MIGKYKSRKNKKRATNGGHINSGVTYRHKIQTTRRGDRFIQSGLKKFLLSRGSDR